MPHTFPKQLETERMILRVPSVNEAQILNDAVIETTDMLRVYLPWAHPINTLETSEDFIKSINIDLEKGKNFQAFMYDKTTGEMIGGCGLHKTTTCYAEIAYWCRQTKQGYGYVTEGVEALEKLVFEDLQLLRLEICYVDKNVDSAAVAKRRGFKVESSAPHRYHVPYTNTVHTYVTAVKFNPSLE